jgi:hypothetical protein
VLYSPPATKTVPSPSTAEAKNRGALVGPPFTTGSPLLSGKEANDDHEPLT